LLFVHLLSQPQIEEESGMSKQAAYKLAHGALNVAWEKLEAQSDTRYTTLLVIVAEGELTSGRPERSTI